MRATPVVIDVGYRGVGPCTFRRRNHATGALRSAMAHGAPPLARAEDCELESAPLRPRFGSAGAGPGAAA